MTNKVLIIVEGKKKDVRLMKKLFSIYLPQKPKEIVAYTTNIYELYGQLVKEYNNDWEDIDLILFLRSKEKDLEKKKILDKNLYTDIILIFDLDFQDGLYSSEKLERMMQYFNNSTDNGRLYIDYPMIESLFHLSNWDEAQNIFNERIVKRSDILKYKEIVNKENCGNDIKKFTKEQFDILTKLNLYKTNNLLNLKPSNSIRCDWQIFYQLLIFECKVLSEQELVYVLNTCILYFYEYNPALFDFKNEINIKNSGNLFNRFLKKVKRILYSLLRLL